MPESHFNVSRNSIVFPISNSITNDISLKVGLVDTSCVGIVLQVLIDIVRGIRYINTSV
jgi:hypothetical protein